MGFDTNEKDRFGQAVSLSEKGQRAIVGAPGADDSSAQVYRFTCDASAGSFTLVWGNSTIGNIRHDATQSHFLSVIRQAKSTIINAPTIRIEGWDVPIDGDGICSERSFNLVVQARPTADEDEIPQILLEATNSTISGTFSVTAASTPRVSF